MSADVVRNVADGIVGRPSSARRLPRDSSIFGDRTSLSAASFNDDNMSMFSRDVERWITGEDSGRIQLPVGTAAANPNNIPRDTPLNSEFPHRTQLTAQPTSSVPPVYSVSTPPSLSTLCHAIWYYVFALMLPIFSVSSCAYQRCDPRLILSATDMFSSSFYRVMNYVRGRLQYLAEEHVARDALAAAMDVLLVIYALGFLFLSLYQAAVSV